MPDDQPPGPDRAPGLAITRGNPSAEEIAAVVLVLSARGQPAGAAAAWPTARTGWTDRSRLLRTPLRHGPDAWRASALPR